MSEPEHEEETTEPTVTDVPEPDQEPDEEEAEHEAQAEHDAEQTPEPDTTPEGRTQEQWEALWKKTEQAFAAYTKKISALWEEDALTLAPFNVDPYAPPGFIDPNHAGRIDEDTKAAAMQFLGFPVEQEYEPDPYAHVCPTCKGKTRTSTGSQSNEYRTRLCPDCKGIGYKDQREPQANGAAPPAFTATDAAQTVSDITVGERDNWGEPRILPDGSRNENYGLMPQYKRPHPVYGITANLDATTLIG